MKFLKKTLAYIVPVALALGMSTSCTKFINIDPEDTLPSEAMDYSDVSYMYQPASGIYATARTQAAHWANAMMMNTRDGDVWSGRVDDEGTAVDFGRYFNYNNGFWALGNVWTTFYNIIRAANTALDELDKFDEYLAPGSDNAKLCNQYRGEVRTIRAWAYYQLVNNFGPIPILYDTYFTDFRRKKVESVYNYLIDELTWCKDNMSRVRPNQMPHVGAVTAFTAEMILAQVQMLKGNWAEVETLTQDIIDKGNFELFADYYNLFKIPGKVCNESLFEIQVTDYGTGSGKYTGIDQYFNFQGPSMTHVDGNIGFGGWNFVSYEYEFVEWCDARDETVRSETAILRANTTTRDGDRVQPNGNPASTQSWNGKAYLPYNQFTLPRMDYGANNNCRVLRYADVLLMNAEAKVRQGKNGDDPVNKVRARAKMPNLTGATVDQILDERRIELCNEWCSRYIDLCRTGKAAQVLGPKGWTEAKRYWPISQGHLDQAPELLEDPID